MAGRPTQSPGERGDEATQVLITWYLRAFEVSGLETRQSLASRAGVAPARLSEFFSGARFPSWPVARRLATALGLEEDEAYRRWTRSARLHRQSRSAARASSGERSSTAPPLPRDVAVLLAAQQDMNSNLPYELFGTDALALDDVYVRERIQASDQGPDARPAHRSAVIPASELVLRRRHSVILGAPGSGKTSMVQQLVHRWAKAWLTPDGESKSDHRLLTLVPLHITAADLIGEGTLPELLAKALTRQLGARLDTLLDPTMFIDGPAPGVEWLVCVDGLDEILDPSRRRNVVQALRWRLVNGTCHRFAVTSRPLFLSELRPLYDAGATDCELLPFTDDQLDVFAERWFAGRGTPGKATTFLTQIRQSPMLDLARVPLLVTIAAVVHENRTAARLPVTRTDLFEEFMRYLLHLRPAAIQSRTRLVASLAVYGSSAEALAEWLFDHRRPLLEHIAADHLSHDEADPATAARDWVQRHAPTHPANTPLEHDVLSALLTSTGTMTTTPGGRMRFTHRALAEFLAARPLAMTLGPDLNDLDDRVCFRRSDHAEYEKTVLTLAAWATAPGQQAELLWRRLNSDNTWQTLLAGRVAAEAAERVPALPDRLLDQLGWYHLTDRAFGPRTNEAFEVLGGLMHQPDVVAKVRALAEEPILHPARRCAALALLARYGHDERAVDQIEELGRRSSAFGAWCAADALIDAGATDRGVAMLWDVLNHAGTPAGWILKAGERMRQAGRKADALRLWKLWLARRTSSSLDTHHLIVAFADLGETTVARRESLRLMETSAARLDARVFSALFLSTTSEGEAHTPDEAAERGRAFLLKTIDDPATKVGHVIWISDRMVSRGIEGEAASMRLRQIRDDPNLAAPDRIRAARGLAALTPEDWTAAEILLATPPPDTSMTEQGWWHAAQLADVLGRDHEADRFRGLAAQRINEPSAVSSIVEQLADRDPTAARNAILDLAARSDDDGVHYETVRLLVRDGWLREACEHVSRQAIAPSISSFWWNAILGMIYTALPAQTARDLATAAAEATDSIHPDHSFWTMTWAGAREDLQPLPVVMTRPIRWPAT